MIEALVTVDRVGAAAHPELAGEFMDAVLAAVQEQVDAWVQPMWDATPESHRHLLRMTQPDVTTAIDTDPALIARNELRILAVQEHPVVWCALPEPAGG